VPNKALQTTALPASLRQTATGLGYRIAIVSTGRFHVLDLARELHALGHHVAFYSLLPLRRARKFGLSSQCHRSLLPHLFPLVIASRFLPKPLSDLADRLLQLAVDFLAAIKLEACDVFIGMSGLCVRSARAAREKHGAKIFIERGSMHTLAQQEILNRIPGNQQEKISNFSITRELWAYDYADIIVIPSRHAEESFTARGVSNAKLFRNPYGVDLSMFPPTKRCNDRPTVLFVGAWSLQKGCDLLWNACEPFDSWHVVHVGSISDAPVPSSPRFHHHDPVEQAQLINFYQRAHVFVLPSRHEGFGLVLAQAMACGLPVVCTDHTGGPDLQQYLSDLKWVQVVPVGDVAALRDAIEAALALAERQRGVRDILESARSKLSWAEYGKRYSDEIMRRLEQQNDAT
jgi:glycosyltransferase involved in cell wall biosynthesis